MPERGDKLDREKITALLRERHNDWSDPLIHQCLEKVNLDNVYPICYVPDLPYWGRDGCVLVGDAAHAMPPVSTPLFYNIAAFLTRYAGQWTRWESSFRGRTSSGSLPCRVS